MHPRLDSASGQRPTQLRKRTSRLAATQALFARSLAAYGEGGLRLVASRFRRWFDHQWSRLRPSKTYQRWIEENTPTHAELAQQRAASITQSNPITISIVCPLYKTPVPILTETIQSVIQQTYPHWQLCLAVSEVESRALWQTVRQFTKADPRIRIVTLDTNRGIADATNAALNAAHGDWVAFLDHDDLLAPQALYLVADYLKQHPECDLVYTDEDLLTANGQYRKTPMLKPDWSPDMLLTYNYICHLVVARRDLIESIGRLRTGYDGAQDWDLLLRIAEKTDRIHHLPEILYHWRESDTSTAGRMGAKTYIATTQEAVLRDCLERRAIDAKPARNRIGHYRLNWNLTEEMRVSIIIPNRNQPNLVRNAVEGVLFDTEYQNTEIIIVDNQSNDPDLMRLYDEWQEIDRVKILEYNAEFNYSKACNLGALAATGEFLLFLNNDVEVIDPTWLNQLLGWANQPGVGVVGGHLIYPDGRTQHAGIVLGLFELAGHMFSAAPSEMASPFGMAESLRNVTAVTGACQLISRRLFESLGGYDEGYELVYSDVDLCLRAYMLGHRIVYAPGCRLIHHECSTRQPGNNVADARRFAEALLSYGITHDPFYHPALSANGRRPQFNSKTSVNVIDNLQMQIQHALELSVADLQQSEPAFAQAAFE